MNRIEKAQAAYKAAKLAYHAEWANGASPALAAAQAQKDAAWAALCAASRGEKFYFEEGAHAAAAQLHELALDDA